MSRGWVIFSCKIFSDLIRAVVILFCTKFTDFSDNIDLQELFRLFGLHLFGLGLCRWLAQKGITTLDLEPEFLSGVRTPALNDYASQRPSCLLESIERLYQSWFIFYTGPQSHYTQRKLGPKAPEWLRKSHGKSKP